MSPAALAGGSETAVGVVEIHIPRDLLGRYLDGKHYNYGCWKWPGREAGENRRNGREKRELGAPRVNRVPNERPVTGANWRPLS